MELRIDLNENEPDEALLLAVLRGIKRGTRPYILSRILLRYLDDYAIPLNDVDKIARCVQFYCNEELPPRGGTGPSVVAAEHRTALFVSKAKTAEKKNRSASKKSTVHKRQIKDGSNKENAISQNTRISGTTASSVPNPSTTVEQEPVRIQEQVADVSEVEAVQDTINGIPKWKDENGRPIPMDRETSQRFKALAPKEYKEYLLLLMNTRATL